MSSANYDKVEGHLANGEIIIKGIDTLLWNLLCLDLVKYSLAEIWKIKKYVNNVNRE